MQTSIDCMACFMHQILKTARLSGTDSETRANTVREMCKVLADFDMTLSPPENAVAVYGRLAELTGIKDPYRNLKVESNSLALRLQEGIRQRIARSADPLFTAVRHAIAGNVIDYGTRHDFDAERIMAECMEIGLSIDHYAQFSRKIYASQDLDILYLADNCGEIVFDLLLIEELVDEGHRVTLVVRGDAILNDVTLQEIGELGMKFPFPVITTGTSCPGIPLRTCSSEVQQAFAGADLVISKGQGNFETLSETDAPLYFLLSVKCAVVADHIRTMHAGPVEISGRGELVLIKKGECNASSTD